MKTAVLAVRLSKRYSRKGSQYVQSTIDFLSIKMPKSFCLSTCLNLLLSIKMFRSNASRVLCFVPTAIQVVLSHWICILCCVAHVFEFRLTCSNLDSISSFVSPFM